MRMRIAGLVRSGHKLRDMQAAGATSISILDAGFGPGTWLRRLVTHARQLGFSSITARGFDVAQAQIHVARRMAHDLAGLPGVNLHFEVADLTGRLPEVDASIDMTLCLYSVLSHLPVDSLPTVAAEIARVTRGHFITTVRSIGSPPTIFVDSIENARRFQPGSQFGPLRGRTPQRASYCVTLSPVFPPASCENDFAPQFRHRRPVWPRHLPQSIQP